MAQWNKVTQQYDNQNKSNFEVTICADRYGNIGNCNGGVSGIGVATGDFSNMSAVHKFGLVEGTNTSNWSTIWTPADTASTILYPWDHPSGSVSVQSTSSQDAPTGSGALSIVVQGLDLSYNPVEEEISLNGSNPVLGNEQFVRVFRAFISSGNTNVGDINITIGGVLVSQVAADYGQTLQCSYTIPAGKTGYIKNIATSTSKQQEIILAIFQKPFDGVFRVATTISLYQMSANQTFEVPIKLQEKTDIDVRIKGSTNATVSCDFEIIMIENEQ